MIGVCLVFCCLGLSGAQQTYGRRPSFERVYPQEILQERIIPRRFDQVLPQARTYGQIAPNFVPALNPAFVPEEFDCRQREDGAYPNPTETCSTYYYMCSNGMTTRQPCPRGLFYDAARLQCEIYMNIFECSGEQPLPSTTPRPQRPRVTTPHPILDCTSQPDGKYSDPRNSCSNHIFICLNGVTQAQRCPEDLYYDVERDECDGYMNVFACSGQYPKPTTQPPFQNPVFPPAPVPVDCENLPTGNHADPVNQCSEIYYTCNHGEGTERRCSTGLRYDAEVDVCDRFENIPVCSGNPRPTTPMPTYAPEPNIPRQTDVFPFDCSNLEDGDYPAGDCDHLYWSCVGGETMRRECPRKLVYDTELAECGHRLDIPACGGVRPQPKKPAQDFIPPPTVNFDCTRKRDGNYPDPDTVCSQEYYTCSGGLAYLFTCAGNLHYFAENDTCATRVSIPACGGRSRSQPDMFRPQPQPILNDIQSSYGRTSSQPSGFGRGSSFGSNIDSRRSQDFSQRSSTYGGGSSVRVQPVQIPQQQRDFNRPRTSAAASYENRPRQIFGSTSQLDSSDFSSRVTSNVRASIPDRSRQTTSNIRPNVPFSNFGYGNQRADRLAGSSTQQDFSPESSFNRPVSAGVNLNLISSNRPAVTGFASYANQPSNQIFGSSSQQDSNIDFSNLVSSVSRPETSVSSFSNSISSNRLTGSSFVPSSSYGNRPSSQVFGSTLPLVGRDAVGADNFITIEASGSSRVNQPASQRRSQLRGNLGNPTGYETKVG